MSARSGAHRRQHVVASIVACLCVASVLAITTTKAEASPAFGTSCAGMGASGGTATFHPLAPVRILDSRSTIGGWVGKLAAGTPRSLVVTGTSGIPAGATAVVGNFTITGGTAASALTVWPSGSAMPGVPLYGFLAGQTFMQSSGAAVGADGGLSFANAAGSVDVVVDVRGYYAPSGAPCVDLEPSTAFDGTVTAGIPASIAVLGGSVPATASAAIVRLDLTAATAATFLTAFTEGSAMPPVSDLIVGAGTGLRASNLVALPIGAGGHIGVSNAVGTVTVRVTVVGYFDPTTSGLTLPGGSISASPAYGTVSMNVTAAATNDPSFSYAWDWGDGTPGSTGAAPSAHTYTSSGQYRIRLTATRKAINYLADYYVAAAAAPAVTGGGFHSVSPTRILDSRTALGGWAAPLASGATQTISLVGGATPAGLPPGTSAVVMNLTVTGATAPSFLTAWPDGAAQPITSNLNFGPGQTIANLATLKLGAAGRVRFANASGATNVIADVVGYYDDGTGPGDLFNGIAPSRLLDSRSAAVGGWTGSLAAGTPRSLAVRAPANPLGVPSSATAIVANVTVTGSTENSFLKVWPTGEAEPGVSNLNFATGQTIPNALVLRLGAGGAISFATAAGATDVVLDVVGYFAADTGSRFHAVVPHRVLDDRIATGLTGPWGPYTTRTLPIAGASGTTVPSGATGLIINVTATNASAGSFVTVFPHGFTRPIASSLNFGPGQTIPNLVTVGLWGLGSIDLYNSAGSVDLIADVVGYFATT